MALGIWELEHETYVATATCPNAFVRRDTGIANIKLKNPPTGPCTRGPSCYQTMSEYLAIGACHSVSRAFSSPSPREDTWSIFSQRSSVELPQLQLVEVYMIERSDLWHRSVSQPAVVDFVGSGRYEE